MDDYESEFLENALFYFLTVTENSYLSTLGGSNVGQCDFFFFYDFLCFIWVVWSPAVKLFLGDCGKVKLNQREAGKYFYFLFI